MKKLVPSSSAFFVLAQIIYFGMLVSRLLIANSVTGQESHMKQFMEPCNIVYSQAHCTDDEYESDEDECILQKTDDCDRSRELYCVSELCQPNCHPSKDIYDHAKGKCYRKIGADCRTALECDTNSVCTRMPITGRGKCQCAKNYTVDPETGRCARSAGYGEFCNSTINCDIFSDIVCSDNACACKSPENQFYHMRRKRCYINIGRKCNGGLKFCPDNSNCIRETQANGTLSEDDETEEERYIGIGLYDEDEEEKIFNCKCEKSHVPSKDGRSCLGLFGQSCSSFHKCQTERSLKCYNETCQCAEPKVQYYDTRSQECRFPESVGMPCESEDGCVEFAECKPQPADAGLEVAIRKCKCISGFIPTAEGYCMKGHGQNCSILMEETPRCNIFAGLECSKDTGTCHCEDLNKYFDVNLQECRDFEIAPHHTIHFGDSDREYMFGVTTSGTSNGVSNLYGVWIGIMWSLWSFPVFFLLIVV